MAIFGKFLHPVFSVSRVQHVSDLHLKFALRPHYVWKYGRHLICGLSAKRKEKRKKKPQGKNIMSASATQGGHNKHGTEL